MAQVGCTKQRCFLLEASIGCHLSVRLADTLFNNRSCWSSVFFTDSGWPVSWAKSPSRRIFQAGRTPLVPIPLFGNESGRNQVLGKGLEGIGYRDVAFQRSGSPMTRQHFKQFLCPLLLVQRVKTFRRSYRAITAGHPSWTYLCRMQMLLNSVLAHNKAPPASMAGALMAENVNGRC